jgi:hypothetical protein
MEAKKNFTFKPRKKGTFGYLGKTGKNTLLLKEYKKSLTDSKSKILDLKPGRTKTSHMGKIKLLTKIINNTAGKSRKKRKYRKTRKSRKSKKHRKNRNRRKGRSKRR